MTSEEEMDLRRHVQRTARRLGLLRGKGRFSVRPLTQRRDPETEQPKREERERLDEPGCSRAWNPGAEQ